MPPRHVQPGIKALYDGQLHKPLKDIVEYMGLRIPESETPIRCHLR